MQVRASLSLCQPRCAANAFLARRIRRIRCDEARPTCNKCTSTGRKCDGYATSPSYPLPGQGPSSAATNLLLSNGGPRSLSSSVSFESMSISPGPSPTPGDRLGAYLAKQVGPITGMSLNLPYWKYLPSRLDNSQALCACLTVFCNSWLNYKTGLPPRQLIDPKLYGRALRSLQAAIDGPEQLKVETLASIVILHRIETLFDLIRGSHVSNHAKGLIGLLQKKGYPNLDDPLETHLLVDMQAAMVSHWLVHRDVNFVHQSGWSDVFKQCAVVVAAAGDDGGLNLAPFHEVDRALGSWADICHDVRAIYNMSDREAAKLEAARKEDEIQQMLDEVRESSQPRIEYMHANGGIEEVADPTSPSGYAYDFPTDKCFEILLSYCTICLILVKVVAALSSIRDKPNPRATMEHRQYCSQMAMFIPWLRRQGALASQLYLSSFCLAHEGATEAEKEAIRMFIADTDNYRQRFPRGVGKQGPYCDYVARCLTGRQDFDLAMRGDTFQADEQ
ncbi:uncharacterized protein F5Z01DRAFT_121890 [Emericellopsis atlantica]|uniref:Zn(2)-C6 fungal-type domain-containing protein n=1 Tax=Emericellopsis atlantica TaxID=2614577 RepID=A0A9P7ZM48_9HYPO|nr:uncharacterized protein F5Z01DRAFT_121890 [Emericellopsis atlantica]KAG9254222.1 hypothetical protein F5Z01DRAFT_121890 [Emericellopsis atlantica]